MELSIVWKLSVHSLEAVSYIKDNFQIDDPVIRAKFYDLLDQFEEIFDEVATVAKIDPVRIPTGEHPPIQEKCRIRNPATYQIASEYA